MKLLALHGPGRVSPVEKFTNLAEISHRMMQKEQELELELEQCTSTQSCWGILRNIILHLILSKKKALSFFC